MISDTRLQKFGLSPSRALLVGPLVRGALATLLFAVAVTQIQVDWRILSATITLRKGADFGIFYRSSQRALHKQDPYRIDGAIESPPHLNPPHVVLLTVPLAYFELR